MRSLILASFALLCAALPALEKASPLPELRTIKTAVLSPSYSCRSAPEFAKGYAQTALFEVKKNWVVLYLRDRRYATAISPTWIKKKTMAEST
jgi:hypothetical protein